MIIKLLLLLSSAFCLVFGICKYINKKVALFSILIIAAFGCYMLGHLYETITLLIFGSPFGDFNIGMLARLGGFAFIFSASFAQLDGLVDDKSSELRKYRLAALIAPLIIAALFIPVLGYEMGTAVKIVYALIFLLAALASYYNFKHLIIKDVSFGIIDSIRAYNLFSLISTILYCVMCIAALSGFETVSSIFALALAASYPCTVISMEKGRQRWIA